MSRIHKNILWFSVRLFVFACCFILSITAFIAFNDSSVDEINLKQKSIFNESTHPLVIAGSSHAGAFSIHNRSEIVKKITGRRLTTINPQGGDIKNIYQLTKLAINNNTKFESFVYMVDPFMLSNNHFGALYDLFNDAPFSLKFLKHLIGEGVHHLTIKNYILASLHLNHLLSKFKPTSKKNISNQNHTEPVKRNIREHYTKERRLRFLHPRGNHLDKNIIDEQQYYFKKTIQLLLKNKIKVFIVIPPTLLGTDINYSNTIGFLTALKEELNIPFYDYSKVMQDQKYFVDHDHLSQEGVSSFTQKYIKPILK